MDLLFISTETPFFSVFRECPPKLSLRVSAILQNCHPIISIPYGSLFILSISYGFLPRPMQGSLGDENRISPLVQNGSNEITVRKKQIIAGIVGQNAKLDHHLERQYNCQAKRLLQII